MEKHDGCASNDKVTGKEVERCERENGDISEDSGKMVLRRRIRSRYKCPSCSLNFDTTDGLGKHVESHKKKAELSKSNEMIKLRGRDFQLQPPKFRLVLGLPGNLISSNRPFSVNDCSNNTLCNDEDGGNSARNEESDNSQIGGSYSGRSSVQGPLDRQISSQPGSKSHKCMLCPKSFGRLGNLKTHMISHTGERPHKCQLCSKSFGLLHHLNSHIRSHTGERPHKCQVCFKSFGQLGSLKTHLLIHTGERPHKCQVCLRSFGRLKTLNIHMIVHTGERPHKCQVCSKSFGRLFGLQRHTRIHTGERPHKCQVCFKSFGRLGNLKTHLRIHTRDGDR